MSSEHDLLLAKYYPVNDGPDRLVVNMLKQHHNFEIRELKQDMRSLCFMSRFTLAMSLLEN